MRNRYHTFIAALFIAVAPAPALCVPLGTFAATDVTKASSLMTTPRPLFFNDLVAFDTEAHRKLALPLQRKSFAFAAGAPVLPLSFAEVGQALHSYPIAFVPEGDSLALVALTGLPLEGLNRNLFVDAGGEWRPNTYIPAYVRGYPFIALRPPEKTEPILAFDPQALDFKAEGGQPLINADGQPSEQLKGIMAFQAEYRQLAERTAAMTKALKDAGVLEEGNLQLQASDTKAEPTKIGGFLVVSEQKLKALPAEALKKLMEADALGLAYAQMFSMGSLGNIFASPIATPSQPTSEAATNPRSKRSGKKAQ